MAKPKRLLVVTQHYWPENFRINDIVQGFLEDGLSVDVLCGLPNYPAGEWFEGYGPNGPFEEQHDGVHIYRSREWRRKGNTYFNIFMNYVTWPLYAWAALGRLPKDYDAVFCFNTSPVLMCWPALRYARRRHIPFTNYVLDIWPENLYSLLPVKNPLLRFAASFVSDWLYKHTDRLIVLSEPIRQRLCERTGMPAERIAVIPQYCEDFYATPLPDEGLQARYGGHFNLLFTGALTPLQSLDTVIEAVCDARAQGAADLQLLLVGDGMSRRELEALTARLDARGYVHFLGTVPAEDIPKYTALADALVVSLADDADLGMTVPAKVASYMAAGKPLLASMGGVGRQAVEQAGNPTSAPGDAKALAANLVDLYAMPAAQRAELGRRAKEYYLAHYRRDVLLRRLEEWTLQDV